MRALARAVPAVLVALLITCTASAACAQFTYYRDDHVRNRPAHIGVSAIGGGQIHTHSGAVDGYMRFGLDVIGTLVPGFAIGFTRLGLSFGYSDAEGVIFGVTGTPTFEFSFFPGSNVQLLLQIGSTISVAAPDNVRPTTRVDAALTTVVGIRFWLGNTFTFGIVLGNDVGLTNPGVTSYFGGPLGQAELGFFGGLEIGWNL
jgi:hypothetical protein